MPVASLRDSTWLLCKMTHKHWGLWVSGAVASVFSWLVSAFGLPVPWWGLALVAALLFVLAAVQAVHDLRLERDELQERLLPVFALSNNDPSCLQVGENREFGNHQMCRVVVSNEGGSTGHDVRVSLVGIRPDYEGFAQRLPLPLLPQHMPLATADYTFSLAPGEKRPIDVFAISSKLPADFSIFHAVQWAAKTVRGIDDDDYLLDIQVRGRDVPTVTRVARIWRDDDRPHLKLLD